MSDRGKARIISRRAAMKALGLAAGAAATGLPARLAEASAHHSDPNLQAVLNKAKPDFRRIKGRDMTSDEEIKYVDVAARIYSFFEQGVVDGGKTVSRGVLPSLYRHANGNDGCQANGPNDEHNTGVKLICNFERLDAAGTGQEDVELALCAYRVGLCAAEVASGGVVTPPDYATAWKNFRTRQCAVSARKGISVQGLGC